MKSAQTIFDRRWPCFCRLMILILLFWVAKTMSAEQAHALQIVQINPVVEMAKPRLPCNQGQKKFCDLRIYQIMVESFVNGDPKRTFNAGYGPSHHSGDLRGIINSLDYIRSLNVNAIWLTPIFDTDSSQDKGDQLRLDATGYFIHDFFKIDPHFGTLSDLRELVQKAHQRGMYVFLDGVFGHAKITGVAPSPTGLKPVLKPCHLEHTGYPGLCAQYPQSRNFFAEVATYWMREAGIDGWRMDQAYQVPIADWHFIQDKILKTAQQTGALGYAVAEVWRHQESGLSEEIQRRAYGTLQQPGLMSAFDFPVHDALIKVLEFSHQPASFLNGPQGMESHNIYPVFAIPNLMLGSHDTMRFGNLLSQADIAKPTDPGYWQRHRLAFAFLTAYSGPITIYYGDEIGDFTSQLANYSDDHAARTDAKILGLTVQPANLDSRAISFKNDVARLMQLKADHPALFSGSRIHLGSGQDYYVDLKIKGREKIIFMMNTGRQPKIFLFPAASIDAHPFKLQDLLTQEIFREKNHTIRIKLPPLSAKFLIVQT